MISLIALNSKLDHLIVWSAILLVAILLVAILLILLNRKKKNEP